MEKVRHQKNHYFNIEYFNLKSSKKVLVLSLEIISWAGYFFKGGQSSGPGREAMLILHHPYAVNHLAILEHTEESLLPFKQCSLIFNSVLWPLLCLCACSSMCAYLVIGDLLQVKVGGVDQLHAGVAVVCAAQGAPVFGVWIEPVGLLSAALQTNQQWSNWICWWWATCLSPALSTKPCVTFTTVAVSRCEPGRILIYRWLNPLWLDDEACPRCSPPHQKTLNQRNSWY